MATDEEARQRAMAMVEDTFERYRILAARKPASMKDMSYFDAHTMSALTLLDASPSGSVLYSLIIDPSYANLNGVMHGGAAGPIFDMGTTTALCPLSKKPDQWWFLGGVTRSLSISYLRAVPVGTTVYVRSWVVSVGRTMAFIRGEMIEALGPTSDVPVTLERLAAIEGVKKPKVYCTAEHHKVNVPAMKEHLAVETAWDRQLVKEEEQRRQKESKL